MIIKRRADFVKNKANDDGSVSVNYRKLCNLSKKLKEDILYLGKYRNFFIQDGCLIFNFCEGEILMVSEKYRKQSSGLDLNDKDDGYITITREKFIDLIGTNHKELYDYILFNREVIDEMPDDEY